MPTLLRYGAVAVLVWAAAEASQQEKRKPDPAPPGKESAQRKDAAGDRSDILGQYNLGKQKLAIEGYDPVSYFEEGGGTPLEGKKDLEIAHGSIRYRFASKENLDRFRRDPARYEPAYGGWCAYAMASAEKVSVDPEAFLLQDGRLLLFYRKKGIFGTNDTRDPWKKSPQELLRKADAAWKAVLDKAREKANEKTPKQP